MDPGPDLSVSVYNTDLELIDQASIPPFGDTMALLIMYQAHRKSLSHCNNG